MKHVLLLLLIGITQLIFSQQAKQFPDDYLGIYKGILNITSSKGDQTLEMEFHLKATEEKEKYQYTIVYIVEGSRQERKYHLLVKDKERGIFEVDENNGIILTAQFFNGVLYSMFEVQGNMLTTTERFYDDKMEFEITFANKEQKLLTGGTSEEIPEVISYPITVVQKAILYKQKS